MKDLYQVHVDITDEIKQTIKPMKVVFPAEYGRLYTHMARLNDIELDPTELLTDEMLDEKMIRHVITLTRCTDAAIAAIETENKASLKAVLEETRKLRDEVTALQRVAYEDGLTKSYNRKWFEDKLLDAERRHVRGNGVVVMVDLNRFKSINDTFGHLVGDKVLAHVAGKLRESGGLVVRYGGDEFLVIFDIAVTLPEIEKKMEEILEYYRGIYFERGKQRFKVGFAYGMAAFSEGNSLEQVIERADTMMYRHKNTYTL